MKKLQVLSFMLLIAIILFGCSSNEKEKQLQDFITTHVKKIKPMEKAVKLANWNASISGKSEDYKKAGELELKLRQVYSNAQEFAALKEIKKSGQVKDSLLARQLTVLYNAYLKNQLEPELLEKIVDLGREIEMKFNTFRAAIKGKAVTNNDILEILKNEKNSNQRKEAWLAGKKVGAVVADDIIRLVKLRNQAAQKLGFNNYHTLSLTTKEQDAAELDRIFSELFELTNEPFAKLKAELDGILAKNYGINVSEFMPWHYHDPFFQETPLVYDIDLDVYYKDKDVKELAVKFFAGIGLPVESIIENSDLYEREGKYPHAFCEDIDRQGDVRILCNLKNNESWMGTILHELGHGVYDKYNDPQTPYLLRKPAHTFTTEAVAMFFGRLSRNAAWMRQMLELTDNQKIEIEKVSAKYTRLKQIIFARWAMVMYDFEKQLYANPDQDLNALWWRMVEKYQLVTKPEGRNEPDWASKIHIALYPCYYHNYLLGEMFASQMHYYLVHNILNLESDANVSYVNQSKVGDFLRKKVFEPGALYSWNDMIKRAAGEPLTSKFFVEQFVK
jgi:peptidyl-dipeptidase A